MTRLMRIILLAAVTAIALAACGKGDADKQKAAQAAAEANKPVQVPGPNATDIAWQQYLVAVVRKNMQGVKTSHPFMYYVPAGDSDEVKSQRERQLGSVSDAVARGVLPGNMLAFGGPDSKTTADLIVDAFKDAQPGSFKDVVVLFVGAAADQDRVKQAVTPSGAEFRFVEMK